MNLTAVAGGFSTLGFMLNGVAAGDFAANVKSAGDVNGDGRGDLIVGADGFDASMFASNVGRAYVVFGQTGGAVINLSTIATGTSSIGFPLTGASADDRAGTTVSGAGDVNGDGFADVLVAAPNSAVPPALQAGRVYVVWGKSTGGGIQLSDVATGTSTLGFAIEGTASSSRLGSALGLSAAGDVNGDGLADVLVGAYLGTGRAFVVLGKTTTTNVNLSLIENTSAPSIGFQIQGVAANDITGHSVAPAGDVNGDGLADVIVGAPTNVSSASNKAGRSFVVFSPYAYAPLAPPLSATYSGRVGPGNGDRQGIGANIYGDDRVSFYDSRLWVDFDGGSAASTVQATITRDNGGTSIPDGVVVGDVLWTMGTTHAGWTTCRVTLRYTDAEVAGIDESLLRVYSAPTVSGPWTLTTSPNSNIARNQTSGIVTSFPRVFALVEVPTAPLAIDIAPQHPATTARQLLRWTVTTTHPVAPTLASTDVVFGGTLEFGVSRYSLTQLTDTTYDLSACFSTNSAVTGTLDVGFAAGAATDFYGNLSSSVTSAASTVGEPAFFADGDVNKDGDVNADDINTLADHIANGTSLP